MGLRMAVQYKPSNLSNQLDVGCQNEPIKCDVEI